MSQIKLSIVVASHLNDIQIEIANGLIHTAQIRAAFLKLVLFHNPDTSKVVDERSLKIFWNQAEAAYSDKLHS